MPKRDPLAAAIAQVRLELPESQATAAMLADDPDAPVNLCVLDAIYAAPEAEEAEALPWLDALLMMTATQPWAEWSDENATGLLQCLEHTCGQYAPGFPMPSICGSIPGWGPISGPIAARALEHLVIADRDSCPDDRSEAICQMWIRLKSLAPGKQALEWAERALMPHLAQAQAEVAAWPADRRQDAEERIKDL